ncbi:DDE superfamily endonuclease [Thermomonospora echinospora]|uniref:DDE superfamily endonuclease n=1 Tax=Thermomonospora echinospora TaxID=1992 RepID=A0A1H6E8H4_9ACTN|nr:transposase [Thermomonospora echinospora]SEG93571.1 DDE superfamily endonuclease [Thermomonospora echinospora]
MYGRVATAAGSPSPCTPARRLPGGTNDSAFATKRRIAAGQAIAAAEAGVVFRTAVADCAYGDLDDLRAELRRAGLGWVVAVRPRRSTWAYRDQAHAP